MLCKPLATVTLPVTGLLAVIANGLRVRSRLRRSGGGYRLRALCLSLFLGPTLLELSRFLHHQHLMRAFLNILLCHFEHPMQFSELLIHAMHMLVRDERPIAGRKRTQNCISSQLIQEREAQPIQSLHISDHLDHMRAQWITFLQLQFIKEC